MKQLPEKFNKHLTDFEECVAALSVAEFRLNASVDKAIADCETVDECYMLIKILPNEFVGVRKVYERMDVIILKEDAQDAKTP